MQHDEVIWQVLRHNHCSYMSTIETGKFCRNTYNVTGIRNRSSCPLANSRYATIREDKGVFYLYMKTIERAHMPNKLWERVKLPANYLKAMEIIDKHMMFWPKLLVHKIKQRLTKMTQMRIRMRKLALKTREKIMTMPRLPSKREPRRLEKAEKAARIDTKIEEELIARLRAGLYGDRRNSREKLLGNKEIEDEIIAPLEKGLYGDYDGSILNAHQGLWSELLGTEDEDENYSTEVEYVEGDYEDLEDEDDIEDFGKHAMTTIDDDDEDEFDSEADDMEVVVEKGSRRDYKSVGSKSKRKPTVLVEVENEDGERPRQRAVRR